MADCDNAQVLALRERMRRRTSNIYPSDPEQNLPWSATVPAVTPHPGSIARSKSVEPPPPAVEVPKAPVSFGPDEFLLIDDPGFRRLWEESKELLAEDPCHNEQRVRQLQVQMRNQAAVIRGKYIPEEQLELVAARKQWLAQQQQQGATTVVDGGPKPSVTLAPAVIPQPTPPTPPPEDSEEKADVDAPLPELKFTDDPVYRRLWAEYHDALAYDPRREVKRCADTLSDLQSLSRALRSGATVHVLRGLAAVPHEARNSEGHFKIALELAGSRLEDVTVTSRDIGGGGYRRGLQVSVSAVKRPAFDREPQQQQLQQQQQLLQEQQQRAMHNPAPPKRSPQRGSRIRVASIVVRDVSKKPPANVQSNIQSGTHVKKLSFLGASPATPAVGEPPATDRAASLTNDLYSRLRVPTRAVGPVQWVAQVMGVQHGQKLDTFMADGILILTLVKPLDHEC